ncbi:hypothetical protein QBC37DRAFT_195767 [Rhypophila decipiens]|uniref:Peptide hydrolase n=1 Tax=Rhypophila decipiens TaxID=261697 RepID=A0AAN7B646_9PEZI|nr:hypothetical protein QBC37DRAFT_195767 [Rhypophila decipiens]
MRFSRLAATSAALFSSAALANDPLTPAKLVADINEVELQRVLWALNKIAKDNGGTRAFGTPGYKASVDYVLERAQTRFGREMDTFVQPFTFVYDETLEIKVTGPDGEDVFVVSPQYNPATPLPGGITASLLNTPVDDTTGSMCLESQWDGIDATGKLVLIKRGVCAVADKLIFAKAKGALGVILYNQTPGTEITTPTLSADNIGKLIPVGIIPLEVATGWIGRLAAGEDLSATLLVDAIAEERETWNVISETKEGDPNKVIMLGAHLDSVLEGPGINDDGSGTAALLEIMGSVKKYKGFPHKIRFGWWAAEEAGLVGSYHYTQNLTPAEADKIKFYFNYDMIASPNPKYEISSYENSGIGVSLLEDYLTAAGKEVEYAEFDGRSDYAGFVELGIPTVGLFTGDGAPWDSCYHKACDDIDNINWEGYVLNTKAAANAVGILAHSLEGVPDRLVTTPNLRGRDKINYQFKRWAALAQEAGSHSLCSHGKKKSTV